MIDCLTNLLLLVNLKKKQLSLSQSADKQEPRTGNLPPVPNRNSESDMDDQRIRKTHLFHQCERDACKMSFVLNELF